MPAPTLEADRDFIFQYFILGEVSMAQIAVGNSVPAATVMTMTAEGPAPVQTDAFFKGKKVVLFGLPGAYTPTCSARHLPGFVEKAEAFAGKGVDAIACLSVNDVFVMHHWGKDNKVEDKVAMLADGNADFTKQLGLEMDGSAFGMGLRCKRFAMIVEDGVVTHLDIEEPGAFEVSSADYVLGKL